MTEDLNVTAHFQPRRYSVNIEVAGTGDVTISSSEDDFPYGDVLELNATTSFGHVFLIGLVSVLIVTRVLLQLRLIRTTI